MVTDLLSLQLAFRALSDAPDGDEDAPAAPEAPPSPYADDVDALADSAGDTD